MGWKLLVGLMVANVGYVLFGGVIFHVLEAKHEQDIVETTLSAYTNFLQNHTDVTEEELAGFVHAVIDAYDSGNLVLPNETNRATSWNFFMACYFSVTVVTTIGYGNISPSTDGGRMFFIFFGLMGIPLMLVLLSKIGTLLTEWNKKLCDKVRSATNSKTSKAVDVTIILLWGFGTFIFLPSLCFSLVEDWTYMESLYYSIASLSTVGFGDYVAGEDLGGYYDVIYRVFLMLWIIVGLAWFAAVIGTIQADMEADMDKKEKLIENGIHDLKGAKDEREEEDSGKNKNVTVAETSNHRSQEETVTQINVKEYGAAPI